MATFAYSGRTRAGQTVTGERIAESIDAAVAALRREQILVTTINPVKEAAKAGPAKVKARRVSAVLESDRGCFRCSSYDLI